MYKLDSGSILLVGDGNCSFSVAFHQKVNPEVKVTTSTIHTEEELSDRHEDANSSIEHLRVAGVEVLFSVDATCLQQCPKLHGRLFNRVIFNFPHIGGKSNIKKNRALLKDFFASAVNVLEPDGEICVTLCRGQGGTPSDLPIRAWPDSWQVVAMAANANLTLRHMWPFRKDDYEEYNSTGFRSMDRQFNTGHAFTYVFRLASPLQDLPVGPVSCAPGRIGYEGQEFKVNQHISKKFGRNLHQRLGHPIHLTTQALLRCLAKGSCCCSTSPDVKCDLASPIVWEPGSAGSCDESQYMIKPVSPKPRTADTGLSLASDTVKDVALEALSLHGSRSSPKDERSHASNICDQQKLDANSFRCKDDLPRLRASILDNCSGLFSRVPFEMFTAVGEVYRRLDYLNDVDLPVQYELVSVETGVHGKTVPQVLTHMKNALLVMFQGLATVECIPVDANDFPSCYKHYFDSDVTWKVDITRSSENHHLTIGCNQVEETGKREKPEHFAEDAILTRTVGFVSKLQAHLTTSAQEYETAVLVLRPDILTLLKYDLPDANILWSNEPAFLDQFSDLSPEDQYQYKPLSLHPPLWRHDVSFWENPDVPFDVRHFVDIIRDVSDNTIRNVVLMNVWKDPWSGQVSHCYREIYQSSQRAISHKLAHAYQNLVRLTVASELKVELR